MAGQISYKKIVLSNKQTINDGEYISFDLSALGLSNLYTSYLITITCSNYGCSFIISIWGTIARVWKIAGETYFNLYTEDRTNLVYIKNQSGTRLNPEIILTQL